MKEYVREDGKRKAYVIKQGDVFIAMHMRYDNGWCNPRYVSGVFSTAEEALKSGIAKINKLK